jgi:murein DD-endopeptidase MepM/ murein hydrolase activator NlpD
VLLRRALPAAALVAALATAAPVDASPGGGTSVPSGNGGSRYGELPHGETPAAPRAERRRAKPRRRARRRRGLVLSSFQIGRPRLFLYGPPARVSFRIDGRARRVRVRLSVLRADDHAVVARLGLGEQPTRVTHSLPFTGREAGVLPQGNYLLRISARDRRGRGLRSTARASSVEDIAFFHHRFPIAGPFSYGGAGSRFGAPRRGHTHQGQDLAASEGTPLVAPRGGVVKVVSYQAGGAGHYVVLHGEGEDRDYVFMHLRAGSTAVRQGQRVLTGQRIGQVGSTGESSGPHLHFEVWVGGGWYEGGHPIDPLPLLRQWPR